MAQVSAPIGRIPDPADDRFVRLACGHMGIAEDECDECRDLGASPDPWLIAGGDINLNRQAESRAYRQSKARL